MQKIIAIRMLLHLLGQHFNRLGYAEAVSAQVQLSTNTSTPTFEQISVTEK